MLSRCFLDFSVGVRASVIGLSQISSFSLNVCVYRESTLGGGGGKQMIIIRLLNHPSWLQDALALFRLHINFYAIFYSAKDEGSMPGTNVWSLLLICFNLARCISSVVLQIHVVFKNCE